MIENRQRVCNNYETDMVFCVVKFHTKDICRRGHENLNVVIYSEYF